MIDRNCHGLCHLAHVPVCFGEFKQVAPMDSHKTLNHEIPAHAIQVLYFNWVVYSFRSGHFALTIFSCNYPFNVTIACDNYEHGRALFRKFLPCPHLFSSGNKMFHHICASGDTSHLHGYLIHSLHFWDSKTTSTFWQLQLLIATQLQTLRNLQMIVAIIIPDHDGHCIKTFTQQLKSAGWCMLFFNNVFFPDLGNSVAGQCNVVIVIHSSCATCVKLLELKPPLPVFPRPIGAFLWEPFNRPEHSVSLARNNNDFCHQDIKFHATNPPVDAHSDSGVVIKYFVHWHGTNESILCGSSIVLSNGLCPPFNAGNN
jgi:hypothetical protein